MKKLLMPVLACGMFASAYSQTDPGEPCCNIVKTNTSTNAVTVRNKTTGRLYQFKAGAQDMKAIKLNDVVNIKAGKITAVGGAAKTYATVQPDYSEPCCNVVTIEPDGIDPINGIVTFKNNITGTLSKFKAPRSITSGLKIGDPVYAEPTGVVESNVHGVEPINGIAVVQLSYGSSDGQMASYGYPIESGDGNNSGGVSSNKWTITPNNLKGSTGRILMDNPAGSKWVVYIYAMADNKYITSFAESNNKGLFVIFPGEYKFTINNAPVLNVPVKKGHDTKLKCGTLDVVSEAVWYLYDEKGETSYTSGNEPAKMPLPIGTYILDIGGTKQTVVIKNGEKVEM